MARQAGKLSTALAKTRRMAQVIRLVARIPRIGPVGLFAGLGRLPMTSTAEYVKFGRTQPARIPDRSRFAMRSYVLAAGPVAGFAMYPCFRRLDGATSIDIQRTGGVAPEAAQNGRNRIECVIPEPFRIGMTRRQSHRFGRRIIGKTVLEVPFLLHLAHIRDCLGSGAKRPVPRTVRRCYRERMSMSAP